MSVLPCHWREKEEAKEEAKAQWSANYADRSPQPPRPPHSGEDVDFYEFGPNTTFVVRLPSLDTKWTPGINFPGLISERQGNDICSDRVTTLEASENTADGSPR